eukprot:TRINITY_DN9791_c0_g2_i1.p1 TRINITY_DN9791_c0_g2~~TRINITY_DN9791_c0_g2_i1.p1  ORF type:complete len:355 (-),score=35.51 TRINITY_DN9791_c0_g2_i1:124-1188(-)
MLPCTWCTESFETWHFLTTCFAVFLALVPVSCQLHAHHEPLHALRADDECFRGCDKDACALGFLQLPYQWRDKNVVLEQDFINDSAAIGEGPVSSSQLGGRWHHHFGNYRKRHGSCAEFGCIGFTRAHACQCNPECVRHRSCCADYSHSCVASLPPAPPIPPAGLPAPAPTIPVAILPPAPPVPHSPDDGSSEVLYHQTSPEIGKLILSEGFKPGRHGWCGGAIYFATSPQATETKAIGPESHLGYMITATLILRKVKRLGSRCHGVQEARREGYSTIVFDPGDGDEYVIWDKDQVVAMHGAPYQRGSAVSNRSTKGGPDGAPPASPPLPAPSLPAHSPAPSNSVVCAWFHVFC